MAVDTIGDSRLVLILSALKTAQQSPAVLAQVVLDAAASIKTIAVQVAASVGTGQNLDIRA